TEATALATIGQVTATNPVKGTFVRAGEVVNVNVYKQPSHVTVPNVLGKYVDAATATLTQGGMTYQNASGNITDQALLGKVSATDPAAGTQVAYGSIVTVYKGTQLVMPNFVGQNFRDCMQIPGSKPFCTGNMTLISSLMLIADSYTERNRAVFTTSPTVNSSNVAATTPNPGTPYSGRISQVILWKNVKAVIPKPKLYENHKVYMNRLTAMGFKNVVSWNVWSKNCGTKEEVFYTQPGIGSTITDANAEVAVIYHAYSDTGQVQSNCRPHI
ncbi:MAG: PASTA domain-containing protein, partial [Gammaproteobacteria bacterium]|nr:PASTA domain-containing protein [Gammaproteobacteria bacterium]